MVEPTALHFLNRRMAKLSQQYQTRPNRTEIVEELSELTALRDQLQRILEKLTHQPKELQPSPEFPTLDTLVHRINTVARQIATSSKGNPHRHELLNELTS